MATPLKKTPAAAHVAALKAVAPSPAPVAAPSTTATTAASNVLAPLTGAKSLVKLAELRESYAKSPNAVTRIASKPFLQQLLGRKLSWAEFCDIKIKAYSDHWTAKKVDPNANKIMRPMTEAQKAKKTDELKKLEARMDAMRKAIGAPTIPAKTVAETAPSNAATTAPIVPTNASEDEDDGDDEEDDE